MLFGLTTLGVWFCTVVSARSFPAKTANNWADVIDTIGASCQLLATFWRVEFENFGVVATMPRLTIGRRSIPGQLRRNSPRFPATETPFAFGYRHRHR